MQTFSDAAEKGEGSVPSVLSAVSPSAKAGARLVDCLHSVKGARLTACQPAIRYIIGHSGQ